MVLYGLSVRLGPLTVARIRFRSALALEPSETTPFAGGRWERRRRKGEFGSFRFVLVADER